MNVRCPSQGAVGDVDGDQRADVVVGSSGCGEGFRIFLADLAAPGGLRPPLVLPGPEVTAVELADVDGDGDLDIIAAHGDQGALVLLQLPPSATDGGFALAFADALFFPPPAGMSGPAELVATDIDGDGFVDLAGPYAAGKVVEIWYQIPATPGGAFAGFEPAVTSATSWSCDDLVIADLDQDGRQDLIVGSTEDRTGRQAPVSVRYQGDPPRTFAAPIDHITPVDSCTSDLAVADLNGDGWLDLAAATTIFCSDFSARLAVHRHSPTQARVFFAPESYWTSSPGDDIRAIAVADLNGDGLTDVTTAGTLDDPTLGTSISMLIQSAEAGLLYGPTYLSRLGPTGPIFHIATGDLDGDIDVDVVAWAEGGSLWVFLQD